MLKNKTSILTVTAALFFQIACSQQQPAVYYPKNAFVNSNANTANSAVSPILADKMPPQGRENLQRQVQELSQTLRSGDFLKIADFTHPKVLEQVGGRAKVVESSKAAIVELKKQGIETDEITVGVPTAAVSVNNNLYATVPMTLVMKTPHGTMQQQSTIVGISSDNGAKWKFVNGVNQEQFNKLFPEAASKLTIPDVKPPTPVK